MKELRELAEFVESFRLKGVGEEVIKAAKYCVLDTVGQALGAKDNPMIREIAKVYALCDGECSGRLVSFWGNEKKVPLRQAVFLNAMMGHTLELDDVHTNSKTHIGTVVIPAAWSLAEYLGKSGRDLLEAVICGYETMARIGMGFGVSSHRNRGWHVTGTAGGFGAAAACAKLLDFTSEQIVGAFGLAGTQACSTWAFLSDGATNKVLHPGRAAANGLESCLLVLGGMRGSSYILDAKDGGIFPMMSDEYDYALVSAGLGKVYELLRMDKKPYPCCRSTHGAIDAGISERPVEGHLIHRCGRLTLLERLERPLGRLRPEDLSAAHRIGRMRRPLLLPLDVAVYRSEHVVISLVTVHLGSPYRPRDPVVGRNRHHTHGPFPILEVAAAEYLHTATHRSILGIDRR